MARAKKNTIGTNEEIELANLHKLENPTHDSERSLDSVFPQRCFPAAMFSLRSLRSDMAVQSCRDVR